MSNIGAEKIAETRPVSISQMTEHDLLEVVEIEETTGLSRWGWEAYYGELAREHETIMLVARPAERPGPGRFRILGFIATRLSANELHINNMAVREEARQLGIGSRLLGTALEEARRRGAHRSFLGAALESARAGAL
jgi:ribosomal protein S18 acetylase RimI-like enzyme